jgi:translation initiation factor 3 subunit F
MGRTVPGSKVVEITRAFAVPHKEISSEEGASGASVKIALGKDYQRTMVNLQTKVTKGERVVGWFTTSPEGTGVGESTGLIHDYYNDTCEDPVHLVVDTKLENDCTSIAAYVAKPLGVAGVAMANMFSEINVSTVVDECEKIFIDSCVKTLPVPGQVVKKDEGDQLLVSMDRLIELLSIASGYVDDVVAGAVPADNTLGRAIANSLSAVPRMSVSSYNKIFNDSLQDLLMVMYLSKLTKTQLVIAEKLTATITI